MPPQLIEEIVEDSDNEATNVPTDNEDIDNESENVQTENEDSDNKPAGSQADDVDINENSNETQTSNNDETNDNTVINQDNWLDDNPVLVKEPEEMVIVVSVVSFETTA